MNEKSKISRVALSKKLRFEVFKRDKFQCQYCGAKAPDVILNVDHITPVAAGGTNDILNLVTSCFSCNSGKKDIKLDDNTAVEKQRKQIELLHEKREQLEFMLEWRKSLSSLDADAIGMVVDYVNSKIEPRFLNAVGKNSVKSWFKKFEVKEILEAIDTAAEKYLEFDENGINPDSASIFINKIGGVLAVKNMPPIGRKLAYIKGIAKNRFDYFDSRQASIILNNYIKALSSKGWTDEKILFDLEHEIEEQTKTAKNWSSWKNIIERWIDDISKWETESEKSKAVKDFYRRNTSVFDQEYFESMAECTFTHEVNPSIDVLLYLSAPYKYFNAKAFREELWLTIGSFLDKIEDIFKENPNNIAIEEDPNFITDFLEKYEICEYFYPRDDEDNAILCYGLYNLARYAIEGILNSVYIPRTLYNRLDSEKYLNALRKIIHLKYYELGIWKK